MLTLRQPLQAVIITLAALVTIACSSNDSSQKAQLAALQQQISDSASLATATAKLASGADYKKCITAATNSAGATDSTAIAACNQISF